MTLNDSTELAVRWMKVDEENMPNEINLAKKFVHLRRPIEKNFSSTAPQVDEVDEVDELQVTPLARAHREVTNVHPPHPPAPLPRKFFTPNSSRMGDLPAQRRLTRAIRTLEAHGETERAAALLDVKLDLARYLDDYARRCVTCEHWDPSEAWYCPPGWGRCCSARSRDELPPRSTCTDYLEMEARS